MQTAVKAECVSDTTRSDMRSSLMEVHKDHESLLIEIESSPYRPSDIECDYLCDRFRVYEDELRKVEEDLAICLANRSRIVRKINRCRGLIAPYNKLPAELIEKIIKYSTSTWTTLPIPHNDINPRLQLTQICRSWRLVAFDIPALWDVYLNELPTRGVVNLIAAWFRQSSSTRIRLGSSRLLDWLDYPDRNYFSEQVLVPYSHRFEGLSIPLNIPHPISMPLDRLTTLSCHPAPWTTSAEPIVAQSLRSLNISHIGLKNHNRLLQDLPPLPWKQLTDISFEGNIEFPDVYHILRQCTALESCFIRALHYDSLSVPNDTLLDLPHLKTLNMDFRHSYIMRRLFMFNTPNLIALTITDIPNSSKFLDNFALYVKQFQTTLRDFKLTTCLLSYEMAPMDRIMQALPSITQFVVERREISSITLAKIGTGELLPNVEELHLEGKQDCPWETIVDCLVPVGQPRQSHLRDIYIRAFHLHADHSELSYRKEELRALGINIHGTERIYGG